ncbi:MAG TPA: amino acid adenylation domain-containing protein [Streptosporangiaceae bacterium]|jgi:amino acid adenylation domain-containing protein|nr:amino acid adenylation domain-containing protein [Streptosporangiaceae bacterium]
MQRPEPSHALPIPARPRQAEPDDLARARRALLELRARRADITRSAITAVPRDRPLPLSFAQQRLWFLDQWVAGRPVYNSALALRISGPLDGQALRVALTAVVARHESLRTRYETERGVPYQVIDPAPPDVPLPVLDLRGSGLPAGERQQRAREVVTEFARSPFDLRKGPVLRATVVRIDDAEYMLGICVHHIATDGWSGGILVRELMAGYEAARAATPPSLPPLEVQYADYAVWQRERLSQANAARQLEYWRTKLADLPSLDLASDRPRQVRPGFAGQSLTLDLSDDLRAGLTDLARQEQATLLAVLLAAFVALLTRYTGQDDIVVGSIFSGRNRPEIEPLIGFFANTMVLRTSSAGNPTFRELIARARDTVIGAHLHQDIDFDQLVAAFSPERDPSRNPLFQVCFTLQNSVADGASVAGLTVVPELVQTGTSRFDLSVHLTEVAGRGLEIWMEFSTELFDPDRMRRLPVHFGRVLEQVAGQPSARIGDLDLLGPTEHAAILASAVAPAEFEAAGCCLHELIEAAVAAGPGRVACRFAGTDLSYGDLNARANRLARYLIATVPATGPESIVGVLLDRGPDLAVSLLAVLKTGAGYLPLDPFHPESRIAQAVRDSGCVAVLTTRALAGLLPAWAPAVVLDDEEVTGTLPGLPGGNLGPTAEPGNIAYLIYTSGSTGTPKGVVVEHRQIVNFTLAVSEMFALAPADRLLQFANPAFDTSAFDFYGAFANGATLVQAPVAVLHDPAALGALMCDEAVTVTDLPPTVLAELDPGGLPALRALFVGMEPFPGDLVNRWNGPGRDFHNGYGPTEATVACIDYLCPDEILVGLPPIGLPMANCTAYALDRFGAHVPAGAIGELYVGGASLARGYHGRPGLTAERFVPDPFGRAGARVYRTGDLVRREASGNLVFHGRADDQIKIRGLRIEPGETEAVLLQHAQVRQVVVTASRASGSAQLVGYVLAEPGAALTAADLRRFAAERLPLFMVPTAFVMLDAFPKNVNGKVDRARLPAPDAGAQRAARIAPRSPAEQQLAEIWGGVLGTSELGVTDDFFALGGNSLKFAQIAARITEQFGISVDLRVLFSHPTIAALAEAIAAGQASPADGEAAPAAPAMSARPGKPGA